MRFSISSIINYVPIYNFYESLISNPKLFFDAHGNVAFTKMKNSTHSGNFWLKKFDIDLIDMQCKNNKER